MVNANAHYRQKYGAVPTIVEGIRFASKREAARYLELRLLERAGQIQDVRLQPTFLLTTGGRPGQGNLVGRYIADFSYLEGGQRVVEDVKGVRTALYQWKKRHLHAEYGITIREVR